MDALFDMFSVIGIIYTLGILFVVFLIVFDGVKDYWLGVKHRYKQKHRFDKPPTAKCYCVDCDYYSLDNHICMIHTGWYVADDWFCWSAEPRKR